MAKIIYSDELPVNGPQTSSYDEQLWVYNGLDNCITFEVYKALLPQDGGFAYLMGRAMQGPALTMMLRGVRVDMAERDRLIIHFEAELKKYSAMFNRLCFEGLGVTINPNSPQQLKHFFYTVLRRPPIKRYDKKKRERVLTTNREALEKLVLDPVSGIFAKLLLQIRDDAKMLSVLKTGIDKDGRLRCTYSTTGTETGRWASRQNVFNSGTNMQNITDEVRRLLKADDGKKLMQFDLKQAESVIVAALSGDPKYIEACESGDPHTYVASLCWPELPWHEANSKKARRAIADRAYYRHFSFRDMAKRGGHGGNYGGTDRVLAANLKIPVKVAQEFLDRYFGPRGFPGIRMWQLRTQQTLAAKRMLTTPLGRVRYFTGRPTDSTTIKEAIAYVPQSTIGDLLNLGLYRVWLELDLPGHIELLAQVHDSILFQFDPLLHNEADLIHRVQQLLTIPLEINGRTWTIGTDAQVGWNWGKVKYDDAGQVKANAYGLLDWNGSDTRSPPEKKSQLDRLVSDVYSPFK